MRVIPQSWGTSNGTFVTDKVGDIEISFVEYSTTKKVQLTPDIVEFKPGHGAPMYDLIMGKDTMCDLGVVFDFKESTIQIDKVLLPMRLLMCVALDLSYPMHVSFYIRGQKLTVLFLSSRTLFTCMDHFFICDIGETTCMNHSVTVM